MITMKYLTENLKKQKLDDVFFAFYSLEDSLQYHDVNIQNLIIVRLVTILEQFFRKIVEIQIPKIDRENLPRMIKIDVFELEQMKDLKKEILISSNYNFQNVDTIENTMKLFSITDIFNEKYVFTSSKHTLASSLTHFCYG